MGNNGRSRCARTIAANGLRLVLEEHRVTTTPTLRERQAGRDEGRLRRRRGRRRSGCGGSSTRRRRAGDLYGRVLVVFAAQHYAHQLVLANSKRRSSVLPSSHKDLARKAFERVTKNALGASHVQLQRALASEACAYAKSVEDMTKRQLEEHAVIASDSETTAVDEDQQDAADDVEDTGSTTTWRWARRATECCPRWGADPERVKDRTPFRDAA